MFVMLSRHDSTVVIVFKPAPIKTFDAFLRVPATPKSEIQG